MRCCLPQVKLLEQPGQQAISIAQFLGKAVEPPLQQSVTSAIQVGEDWRSLAYKTFSLHGWCQGSAVAAIPAGCESVADQWNTLD